MSALTRTLTPLLAGTALIGCGGGGGLDTLQAPPWQNFSFPVAKLLTSTGTQDLKGQELRSGSTVNFSVDVSKLEKDNISISAAEINFYRGSCPPSDDSIKPVYTIELSNKQNMTIQGEAQLNLPTGVYSTKVKAFSSTSGGAKYTYSGFSCSNDRGAFIVIVK